MSEDNRFFLWVWRFNAVLLGLLGLSLIAGAALLLASLPLGFFERGSEHKTSTDNFLAAAHSPAANVTYELSGGTHFDGTSFVTFNLQRNVEPSTNDRLRISSGAPYHEENTVNILAVDGADATSHWLFKGLNHSILAEENQITAITASDTPNSPVTALVIDALNARPDKSGALIANQLDELYFYRLGSDAAIEFFSARDISSVIQVNAGKLLVVYKNGESIGSATFSTTDFKLIAQSRVAPVPK
jgi:hypothetical protein